MNIFRDIVVRSVLLHDLRVTIGLLLLINDGRVVHRHVCGYTLATLIEPALDFALEPLALLNDALLVGEESKAVLLAILPLAIVLSTIFPDQYAVAFLSIVGEFAFIRASIVPPEDSLSMHFVTEPLALIISAV